MSENVPLKINLGEAYRATLKDIEENLHEANRIWFGAVRLIITLSTSILLLSVALIDRLFPLKNASVLIRNILVIGWLLLFITIIFGIISELDGARFFQKLAKNKTTLMKDYMCKISQGKEFDIIQENLDQRYIEDLPIFWGRLEINSFIIAILCLAIYFLGNIFSITSCTLILILGIVIIIVWWLNYSLGKKQS